MNMIHRVNVEFPDVYILVRLYRNFSRPWDEFHQSIQPAISSIQENIDNYRGNIVVLLNDDSWTDDEAALKEHQSNITFIQGGGTAVLYLSGQEERGLLMPCWH